MSDWGDIVVIDGSAGGGGGQVLRSALSLSAATGRPLRLVNIRAGRDRPGLMRRHLACLRAAAEVADADVKGDTLGSRSVHFTPASVRAGRYVFKLGTAGSCSLLLQTVLPPLLTVDDPSVIELEGGTHVPGAPPFELIERAYIPALEAMGARISARLERRGFAPAGGGRVVVELTPGASKPFRSVEPPTIKHRYAEALFAHLPAKIAERELVVLASRLGLAASDLHVREVRSDGPGNSLIITMEHDQGAEVVAEFGTQGRSAETVAEMAAREAEVFMAGGAAVGRRLADQLLIPMALLGGGRFRTVRPSRHCLTNVNLIRQFSSDTVGLRKVDDAGRLHDVEIKPIAKSRQKKPQ